MHNDGDNPAIEEFENKALAEVDEKKRQFVNTRETVIDVLIEMDRQHNLKCAKKLKKRAVDSRSLNELRFIMDGLLVLAGYTVRSVE